MASLIGFYSLVFGLCLSFLIILFSIKNFRNLNLFEEEKGVVAEGFLKDRNYFSATKILAKHDENYMPPEVKAAMEGK